MACDLIFTSPLPTAQELYEYYQGFLFHQPDEKSIPPEIERRKKQLKHYFNVDENSSGKSFLDYGGGTGIMYHTAASIGLDTYYFDLDEEAKNFTRRQFGLTDKNIITDLGEKKFDYIFSDNVIEHVKDPIAFTKDLYDQLKEGGELVLLTPNGRNTEIFFYPIIVYALYVKEAIRYNGFSELFTILIHRPWHCDPPRHLFALTKKSFITLAQKIGVSERNYSVRTESIALFEYSATKAFFDWSKQENFLLKLIKKLILLAFLPFEILSKLIQLLCSSLGLLSRPLLVLKIKK